MFCLSYYGEQKHDYLPKENIITVGTGESGYISANKVWSGDTIKVVGDITVEKGVTLTVNSGVYVEFQGHFKLNVYGRLLAVGGSGDTIVFTAKNTSSGWHGLRFFNSNTNNQDTSKVVFCKLEYGKAAGSTPNQPIHSNVSTTPEAAKGYATKSDYMKDSQDKRYGKDPGYTKAVENKLVATDTIVWYDGLQRY